VTKRERIDRDVLHRRAQVAVLSGLAAGDDHAVVSERGGRIAVPVGGGAEGGQHDGAGDPGCAETCSASREWSSSQVMISMSAPVVSR
jgi:hypothetical protein